MRKFITRKKLKHLYPFTLTEGWLVVLITEQVMSNGTPIPFILFEAGGETYALNGYARASGQYRDYEDIWQDHPMQKDKKITTSKVMELAADLMKKHAPDVHQRIYGAVS